MLQKYGTSLLFIAALLFSAVCGYQYADSGWTAKWAEYEKDRAEQNRQQMQKLIQRHNDLVFEMRRVEVETKKQIAAAVAAERDADRAAEQLHDAAQSLARTGSDCPAATTGERAAIATDRIVLADVLGRIDKTAGELAAYADQARIRGLAAQAHANELYAQREYKN